MNYQEKYIKYKNKYLDAKFRIDFVKNIDAKLNILGGSDCIKMSIDPFDFSSFLKYIENKYNCQGKNKVTKNKYFVILYGPSSSGKTLARKIATNIIKKFFNETQSEKELFDTFMDSGVDELTYDKQFRDDEQNTTVLDKLKQVYETYIKENNITITEQNKYEIIHEHIDNLIKQSLFPIYMKHRKERIDNLSELMIFLAAFLNKNIFFEVATASIDYIYNILSFLIWHNYIPIIIYPFTYNTNLLYKRSIDRGIQEGRFLKCSGDFSLEWQIELNIKKFNERLLKEFPDKYKQCLIYRYNTNIDIEDYNSFNNFDFTNLDKYTLSYMNRNGSNLESNNWSEIPMIIQKCDTKLLKN